MKKMVSLLTAIVLAATAIVASAVSIVGYEYTDVPTAMTQDSVLSLEATQECKVETLQPNVESFLLLNDVYRFTYEENNRPARYYDEPTQKKISELCDNLDIDVLHMTEAMRLQLVGTPEEAVVVDMEMDVEYYPGQLVVVVLGIPGKNLDYTWYPYRAEIPETGLIRWEIPLEDWEELAKQPISFHALTIRTGPDGEIIWGRDYYQESEKIFSKDADDVYRTHYWYSESGEAIEEDFRLFLTDLTDPMQMEVYRIGTHLAEGGLLLDYFPEERKEEALLTLPEDVKEEDLVAYDVIALMDEKYKDTYGDVNVEIQFGTTYDTEKAMVVLAGFEIKDAREQPYMDWYVLRAEAIEFIKDQNLTDQVRIGLKQLNLPWMEEEPMMLVVISEVLEEQK